MKMDLNLLLVFDAIMTERNFRLAAERLGRTQPAISQSVARLRDIFGDQLFQKTPTGVRPTRRAEALWQRVRDPIGALAEEFSAEHFDPTEHHGEFSIGMSDDVHELCFAHLVSHFRERAPALAIKASELDHQTVWEQVGDGNVDLALCVAPPAPRGLGDHVLLEQPFVLLHRPDASPPISLKAYLKQTHVAVGFGHDELGYTDRRLAGMGHRRTIIASTPRFASIPELVLRTGAIATMPAPIARKHAGDFGLMVAKLPFDLDPVAVRLCWHERRRRDPINIWLREQLATVVHERMGREAT